MPRLVFESCSILTLDTETKPQYYENGTVVVEKDMIILVLDGLLAETERKIDDKRIDASDKLLMPGLVDLHFHTAILKGWNDSMPLWEYLTHCWYPSIRSLDVESAYWAALASYLEAIKCGTTQVNDMYRFLPSLAKAAEKIGIRATLANDIALDEHKLDTLQDNLDAFNLVHNSANGRIRVNMGIEWLPLSDEKLLRDTKAIMDKTGMGLHIHLNESQSEVEDSRKRFDGRGPTEVAFDCGILGPKTTAAHCVHLSDKEIALMAQTGTSISHNPSSNAKLGNGVARLLKWLEAGINVGLGHDAAECNNSNSLFQVMKFASLVHRAVNQDASLLPPARILRMACENGSKALQTNAGIIASGYKADFILLNLNHIAMTPLDRSSMDQVMSHIVFACDGDVVDTSVIDGRIVMEGRTLVFVNEQEVIEETSKVFLRIKKDLSSRLP